MFKLIGSWFTLLRGRPTLIRATGAVVDGWVPPAKNNLFHSRRMSAEVED